MYPLLRLGNLVRHKSGGPIMVVDREVFRSPLEPLISCVWVEARQRHHASFKEGTLKQCMATDYRSEK